VAIRRHLVHVLGATTKQPDSPLSMNGMAAIAANDKPAELQKATPTARVQNRNKQANDATLGIDRGCDTRN